MLGRSARRRCTRDRRSTAGLPRRLLSTGGGSPRGAVGVSLTRPDRRAAQPVWPASLAREAQRLSADLAAAASSSSAVVTGHTTPNLADVGGASVRLRLAQPLGEGGYLLGIRSREHAHGWLPAVAGVPGAHRSDHLQFFRWRASRSEPWRALNTPRPGCARLSQAIAAQTTTGSSATASRNACSSAGPFSGSSTRPVQRRGMRMRSW